MYRDRSPNMQTLEAGQGTKYVQIFIVISFVKEGI